MEELKKLLNKEFPELVQKLQNQDTPIEISELISDILIDEWNHADHQRRCNKRVSVHPETHIRGIIEHNSLFKYFIEMDSMISCMSVLRQAMDFLEVTTIPRSTNKLSHLLK